jgi:microcystin-dependent protein
VSNLSAFLTTDDIPTGEQCLSVFLPAGDEWLARIMGALSLLIYPENWEKYGVKTPDECAEAWAPYFELASFREGTCRVIGEIITWAGNTSPDLKWLICDGASLLRASYPDLFVVIGTTYGATDGAHFSLPDLRGRVAIGAGTGGGLSTYTRGQTGGEEAHQLTGAEAPSHSHSDTGHTHAEGNAIPTAITIGAGLPAPSALPAVGATGLGFAGISSSGGDGSHNNIQPFLALNYLIVALP